MTSCLPPANRLLEDDAFTYTYDATGTLATKTDKLTLAVTTYTYDVEHQLTRIDLPGGGVATYRYDALGRRTEKAVGGALTRYAYEGEDIWVQVDAVRNCPTHLVFHGPGLDQPVGFLMDQEGDCNFTTAGFTEPALYLQTDGLGSLTTLINQTRGFFRSSFLAERTTYDAFGTPTFQTPGPDGRADTADDVISDHSAFNHPYAFTGREWDPESGLHYYRARYYDPKLGRFLQEDPLGIAAGPNLYTYVQNNPIRFVDPWGLLTEVIYENPVGANIFGHSAIRVNGKVYDVTTRGAGGVVRERDWQSVRSDERSEQRIQVPLTPDQEKKLETSLKRQVGNPYGYNLCFNNCANFLEDEFDKAGVPLPDDIIEFPLDTLKQASEIEGASCPLEGQ